MWLANIKLLELFLESNNCSWLCLDREIVIKMLTFLNCCYLLNFCEIIYLLFIPIIIQVLIVATVMRVIVLQYSRDAAMAARRCRILGRINCVAPERVIQRRVACFGSFRLYVGGSQYHHHFSDVDHTFLCVLVFEILLWENHESSYLKF